MVGATTYHGVMDIPIGAMMVGVIKSKFQMPMYHSCFASISLLPKEDKLFLRMARVYSINLALMSLISVANSNSQTLDVLEAIQTVLSGLLAK